eukprot:Skav232059  [mRNA]  locus=scaffold1641:102635:104339:- [translate_table: standard]
MICQEEHLHYGTFFWDVGAEVVYHLSGRKLLAEDAAERRDVPEGLYGVATATATFTAVAAGRTMYVAGLALPKAKGGSGRFKGRCYVCGERGHSKSNCSMTNLEKRPTEACTAVAGCEGIEPLERELGEEKGRNGEMVIDDMLWIWCVHVRAKWVNF